MTNSTKTTQVSAVFLAAVLVAGTIALSFPSFMVGAQAAPYYGMEKKYDSYESDYGSDYGKDSYDKRSYGNDDYGQDSYDKRSYGNDDYGQDSYDKRSYDKNDRKKSSDSVSIKKIKCNNINLNLNNIDASIGVPPVFGDTDGTGAAGGAVAAESLAANGMGNGNGNGERSYGDRENNFRFVCINNNNNVASNATDGVVEPEPEPPTDPDCTIGVACIKGNLDATQLAIFYTAIGITADATDEELCIALGDTNEDDLRADLEAQVTPQLATFIINCLIRAGFDNLGEIQTI
jgi:hypothetical protein